MLLHICCAPDATVPLLDLKAEGWEVVGYFYGSNIHPQDEYLKRADAVEALAGHEKTSVSMRPYDPNEWLDRTAFLADEPERGRRCALCFELQLEAAADEGVRLNATHLCTTLSISPHKDVTLISRLGREIAASRGLLWEDRIWRKNNGFLRSLALCRDLGLYRQTWCGCVYSCRAAVREPVREGACVR